MEQDLVVVEGLMCSNDPQSCVAQSLTLLAGSLVATRPEGRVQTNHGLNPKSSTVDQVEEHIKISTAIKTEEGFRKMTGFCHLGFSFVSGLRSPPYQDCVLLLPCTNFLMLNQVTLMTSSC